MKMAEEPDGVQIGTELEGSRELPDCRILPLNSKRLTSLHLKQLAEKLELPIGGSAD